MMDRDDNINNTLDTDDDHHDDPEDEFQSQMWTYSVWVASIPLLYYGFYKAALCFIGIGLMCIFQSYFIHQSSSNIPLIDQYKIKYDIYSPEDIIKDISAIHEKHLTNEHPEKRLHNPTDRSIDGDSKSSALHRDIVLLAFSILAKKYNQLLEEQKIVQQQGTEQNQYRNSSMSKVTTGSTILHNKKQYDDKLQHLAEKYQDMVHMLVFVEEKQVHEPVTAASTSLDDDNDEIIAATLALLALISKHDVVRQRYDSNHNVPESFTKDVKETTTGTRASSLKKLHLDFGTILHYIDTALCRAKRYNHETKDRIAAELQRKACLFIGAISDDAVASNDHPKGGQPMSLSIQIGQRGGIQTILNAISWYQYHTEVVNWGLWSIFSLCYEHRINQVILIQLNGIQILLQSMKNCLEDDSNNVSSIDVARHGTAILFDVLREHDNTSAGDTVTSTDIMIDRWKVRDAAISSGLHACIVKAMMTCISSTNMDVFVMGREILIGTNYQGSMPEPPMTLIPASSSPSPS